jgi:HAD superfamily phosphatase (TIGR01668 family)
MLSLVTPDLQIDNVLELTVDRVRSLHLDGLLLDMDCTLKDYHDRHCNAEVLQWIKTLSSSGIQLCIMSNAKLERLLPLVETIGIPFVAKAFKPLPFGCKSGLQKLQLSAQRTAMVGDQLFSDVLAGRLAGLYTILVRPTSAEEPWFTRIKRPMERRVLRRINHQHQSTWAQSR